MNLILLNKILIFMEKHCIQTHFFRYIKFMLLLLFHKLWLVYMILANVAS